LKQEKPERQLKMSNSWDSTVNTDAYLRTLERALKFATERGYVLNPDNERVEKVIGLMTMNHSAAGDFFCPCKQSHPLDTVKDVVCPCPELSEEVAAEGCCFCRLFFA